MDQQVNNMNKTKKISQENKLKTKKIETKKIQEITNNKNQIDIERNKILSDYDLNLMRVIKIKPISHDTNIYRLTPVDGSILKSFKSGQYIEVKINHNGHLYSRKYSICSSPFETEKFNYYEIIVQNKPSSIVSKKIYNEWDLFTKVVISKPLGNFYYWDDFEYSNICAITNNVGVAPIYSFAKSILEHTLDVNITIFNVAKNRDELLLEKQFKELSLASNKIKVINVLEEQKINGYEHGKININMISKYCNVQNSTFYICGINKICNSIINRINNKTTKYFK